MVKTAKPPKAGLTPGKAVLIGVLSVVFLCVIVSQFGGKKKSTAAVSPRSRRSASRSQPATESAQPAAVAPVSKRSEMPWPTFQVEQVVASNPFALPAELIEDGQDESTLTAGPPTGEDAVSVAAVESAQIREMRRRRVDFLASLRATGVDMILRSPRGSVARVGDMSLRVGEVYEGLKVEAISQDGIVFAPFDEADPPPE